MVIETPVVRPEEEEHCGQCGHLLFKAYQDKGFVFVEIRCTTPGCGKFVIRKFVAYERKPNGGKHA